MTSSLQNADKGVNNIQLSKEGAFVFCCDMFSYRRCITYVTHFWNLIYIKKEEGRSPKRCRFEQHYSSSPRRVVREEEGFLICFFFALSLSLSPPLSQTLSKPNTTHAPSWGKTKGVVPCKRLPIGHFVRHRGRVGWPRSPCATMVQG